jgi:hypothetical protein
MLGKLRLKELICANLRRAAIDPYADLPNNFVAEHPVLPTRHVSMDFPGKIS